MEFGCLTTDERVESAVVRTCTFNLSCGVGLAGYDPNASALSNAVIVVAAIYVNGKSPNWGTCVTSFNTMQRHFGRIEALDDIGDILRYAANVCLEQKVVRYSYHFTPLFDAANSPRTVVIAEGYDPDWLAQYEQADFRACDPIPQRTMAHGAMLTWHDAMKIGANTPANIRYFEAMRENGLIHGFGIPLFGPRGRDAYASFDFDKPVSDVDPQALGLVRTVPQAAHQRVCVLLEAAKVRPELSEREQEVIEWVSRGKSLSAIATILDLSPDTVKTYTKRIYAKLDASDRVGATVKALKLGLVNV